jgi:hypothetical protein
MAFDLVFHHQEGPATVPSTTMRRTTAGTIEPRNGWGTPAHRAPQGAQKVAVPFPDAWADAWESYEFAEEACGHSPKSIQIHRTSVLRLAKMYPERAPEDITRRDLESTSAECGRRSSP